MVKDDPTCKAAQETDIKERLWGEETFREAKGGMFERIALKHVYYHK